MRPSFLAHITNGITLCIAIIMLLSYLIYKNVDLQLLSVVLLLSIAIGIHGVSHMYEEVYFGWNPMIGHWKVEDQPTCTCFKQ